MKKYFWTILILLIFTFLFGNVFHAGEKEQKSEKLDIIISEKLGNINYEIEYLEDFSGEKRYVLIEGEKCYLIYDLEIDDYSECSTSNNSPYYDFDIGYIKVYYGPTFYFYRNGSDFYDVISNKKLKQSDIDEFSLREKEIIDVYNNTRKEDSKSIENRTSTYIPDDYYFRNLTTNFGTNTIDDYPGSCGYVAIEMLLSYYDTFYNDNIIDDYYDIESTKNFSYYSQLDVSSYTPSPGINDNFHEYLIGMGRNAGYTNTNAYNIDWTEIDDFLEDYFASRNMNVVVNTAPILYANKPQFIKDAIDDGAPVIVGIYGIDTNINPNFIDHSVVAYGYNGNDIYAHFGWPSNFYSDETINNYWISIAHYIDLNVSHVHSDNYLWTVGSYNGCEGEICPCGHITITDHSSESCTYYNTFEHRYYCSNCEYAYYESHHYVQQGTVLICEGCGNEVDTCPHNITYNWVNYISHRVICNMCSLDYTEPHLVDMSAPNNGQYYECVLCLGVATHGIILKGKTNSVFALVEE